MMILDFRLCCLLHMMRWRIVSAIFLLIWFLKNSTFRISRRGIQIGRFDDPATRSNEAALMMPVHD
nr:hypothetical protein RSP597_22060 [Ralstonia solanacearum]